MRRSRYQSGFTLIEVTVALALMALIATLLVSALELGSHCWQRVTTMSTAVDEMEQAQNFLREHLSALLFSSEDLRDKHAPVIAANDKLSFTSSSPGSGSSGSRRYSIYLDPNTHTLRVSLGDSYARINDSPQEDSEALLTGVNEFTTHFYTAKNGEWRSNWDQLEPPELVRIDITFLPSIRKEWLPLYVRPLVDTPIDCPFDVVRRRCRDVT